MKEFKIVEFKKVLYDDHGFYQENERDTIIEWIKVFRIAEIYFINDIVFESMYYWAFQSDDPFITYWVRIEYQNNDFKLELKRRYEYPKVPHVTKWKEVELNQGKLCNYVIWPQKQIGEAMYIQAKRYFWQVDRKILYKTIQ